MVNMRLMFFIDPSEIVSVHIYCENLLMSYEKFVEMNIKEDGILWARIPQYNVEIGCYNIFMRMSCICLVFPYIISLCSKDSRLYI